MSRVETERQRFWWTHHSIERRSFRWWSYIRMRDFVSIEMSWLSGLVGIGLRTMHGKWTFDICLGLVALFVSWPARYRNYGDDREIKISFHDGAIWWAFWTDPMSWSSTTPKYRYGNFNFVDFALGRSKCDHRTLEERDVLVPMPEGAYPARAKLEEWTWRRPRWFAKTIKRCSIDIPNGIPFPGKGENSWDCGDDATYGITTGECRTIAEGVGKLVGSVLNSRVRYGGWGSWSWHKAPPPNGPPSAVQERDT